MTVLDLDGDRNAVVGRVALDGKEYDVLAMSMAHADALMGCKSIADALAIIAEAVPTMSPETLRSLNAPQIKTIVELATHGNAGGQVAFGARRVH